MFIVISGCLPGINCIRHNMFRNSNMQLSVVLMGVAALCLGAVAYSMDINPTITFPVVTNFFTADVQEIATPDESIKMIGNLCEGQKGKAVNVTVLLPNNPSWNPEMGVVWYSVSNAGLGPIGSGFGKTGSGVLCTNNISGVAMPYCNVPSWPGGNQIDIIATAYNTVGVTFVANAKFFAITQKEATILRSNVPVNSKSDKVVLDTSSGHSEVVYLMERISLLTAQSLAYLQSALLNLTFCPNPQTGNRYIVHSEILATDDQSLFTQFICDKLPCTVDGSNVIANNGRQLPVNVVDTPVGEWKTLYAVVICWGGVYDPIKGTYVGHFRFNAEQV